MNTQLSMTRPTTTVLRSPRDFADQRRAFCGKQNDAMTASVLNEPKKSTSVCENDAEAGELRWDGRYGLGLWFA